MIRDIKKNGGNTIRNLTNQWEIAKSTSNGVELGDRSLFQALALPDGKSFFIQGGFNMKNSTITDQTIIYNAETDRWSARANYSETENGGVRQMQLVLY